MLRRTSLALALVLASCDGPAPTDAGPIDSGARRDSGPPDAAMDAGRDGGMDAGDGGMDAGRDGGDDASVGCVGPPGLYAEGSCTELADGVRPFEPRFPLWSDDADKERFVYLPPGTQIDTTDPDRWGFPRGTRLYKTFTIDGLRIETRLIEKVAEPRGTDSWRMVTFAWSADQRTVREVGPFGEEDALGTGHEIPTRAECVFCHSIAQDDAINGFSALQLNHEGDGVTLATLINEGWLTAPIALEDATVPGDATAQAALGYMHSNCGSCHGGPAPDRGLDLWLPVGVAEVTDTPAWRTSVCVCSGWTDAESGSELRIAPGDPARSVSLVRMARRVRLEQMPPIATRFVDPEGVRVLSEWIASLDPSANGCPHGCPWP